MCDLVDYFLKSPTFNFVTYTMVQLKCNLMPGHISKGVGDGVTSEARALPLFDSLNQFSNQ